MCGWGKKSDKHTCCCCSGAAEGGCRKFWWVPKLDVPDSGVEKGGNDQPGPPPTAPVVGPFAGAPATCTVLDVQITHMAYTCIHPSKLPASHVVARQNRGTMASVCL